LLPSDHGRGRLVVQMLAAFAMLAACLAPVCAAEIKTGFPYDEVVLEGIIEPGDYNALRDYVAKNPVASIYLASPGGDLAEAIRIGHLVRSVDLETTVPGKETPDLRQKLGARHHLKNAQANFMCASACFFVFVAGVRRDMDLTPYDEALLGIHRPYLTEAELRRIDARDAMASAKNTRAVVEDYLKAMSVPVKYVDRMFSVPKEQIEWIGAEDFKADFEGFIPELRDWMSARCDKRTDIEKAMWEALKDKLPADMTPEEKKIAQMLGEKMFAIDQCESDALAELSAKAKLEVLGGN
jgi:hypothetical protein